MNTKPIQLRFLGPVFLGLLTACSGGDVNIPVEVPPFTPLTPLSTSEAITTHGVITGLDDVSVNGVRYAANSVTVTTNGQSGTLFDLRHGQIVTVSGRINGNDQSGTANSIRFDANLIGPVESLDASSDRVIVMGQPVITGPDTIFGAGIDPATFAGLSVDSNVQVSGFANAAGTILATWIDTDVTSTELQLIGRVAGLDLANLLFTVNRLTVDYSSAIVIDLPGGAPTNGMMVKAIGTMSSGLFIVERLVSVSGLAGSTGQRVQAAGVITRFSSSTDFDINDSAIVANAQTAFFDGAVGDLAVNTELVIDGEFASGGRITANRITFGRHVNPATTVTFDPSAFTEVSISSIFNATITQGPDFLVEVTIDEDVVDRVVVTKAGARLNIGLSPGDGDIDTLEAIVTLPELNSIDLDGVVNVILNDFDQSQMTVNVGGVSRLQGNGLMIGNLTASISGVSQLNFGDIRPIGNANIDVSGVSQATLNMDVGSTMTGSVGTGQGTGTSTLFYYGTNVAVDITTDATSSVIKLGESRP